MFECLNVKFICLIRCLRVKALVGAYIREKTVVAIRFLLRSLCTLMSKLENLVTSDSGSNLVTSDYPRLTTAAYQTCFLIRSLELHTTM